ncbi:MAG: hypothetical protein IJD93_06500 [Ruminococcus sp.]|nr:hypothetical protein [Ruminococcus sp.]
MANLLSYIFFLIPLAFFVFFAVSLILFLVAKAKNKKAPDTYSKAQIKTRKILLIISGVIAGILLAVITALVLLLYMAVAYM